MSEQQGTELRTTLLGRLVERREGPLICRVHTCVVLDQQCRNVNVLQGGEADRYRGNRNRGGAEMLSGSDLCRFKCFTWSKNTNTHV